MGVLEGTGFVRSVTNYEQPALVLLRRLAGIIRSTDDRIVSLSFMSAEQHICLELLRYIEPDPGDTRQLRVFPVPTQAVSKACRFLCVTRL